jgi:WD40 repeat protein
MADSDCSEPVKQLDEDYWFSDEYNCSSIYDETLLRGNEILVLLSSSGDVMETMELPSEDKLIASDRSSSGWEILIQKDDELFISKFPHNQDRPPVFLEQAEKNARTAVWSPCRKYIAVGNSYNSTISVWHTDTGKIHWKQAVQFEEEGEMLNPPLLKVISWSQDGNNIVSFAGSDFAFLVVVWDSKRGVMKTIIS